MTMSRAFEITPAFIYDVWLQKAAVVAGYTLLVHDYFLTLSDEVEYIWSAPWTPVKSIYLANRYIALLGQTVICMQTTGFVAAVTGGCEFYAIFFGAYILVSLETAHVLVFLRAWAIWGGNRRILWFVVIAYVTSLVSIVAAVTKGQDFSNFEPTVASGCDRPVPDRAWLFYLVSLVVDSLLFCITMSGLRSYSKSFNGSLELIHVLMRGAIAFYVVNVCYGVLGIVCWTRYQNSPSSFTVTGLFIPVLAICSQRVVHDLRQAAPLPCSTRDLSQVIDRQVEGFAFWSRSPDLGRETSPIIEETDDATDDRSELRIDDNVGFSSSTPSFDPGSYSLVEIARVSVSSDRRVLAACTTPLGSLSDHRCFP
ncbi:hypothetical protein EV401DRAFT_1963267 [Pisolithus croceorrhizus]|nr:hypothetical protein EV401DRAFT_1963267 [Pisolithus croceorrhizus]